jgi:integrase
MAATQARARHRDWLSDIEARISNIRAERKGEGQTLTQMHARALAGRWYRWWTTKQQTKPLPLAHWKEFRDHLIDRAWAGAGDVGDPEAPDWNPAAVWDDNYDARAPARAMAADYGETSQFLHSEQLPLEAAARELFLDYVCKDLFGALDLLIRRARGDYSEDTLPQEFPTFARMADPGFTFEALFERWVCAAGPKPGTVRRWRAVFLKLAQDFPEHGAAALTTDEVREWLPSLITQKRAAVTVRRVWSRAGTTVFAWAAEHKVVPHNPFAGVAVTVPRKSSHREGKWFNDDEIKKILQAAAAITDPKSQADTWRRWAPWLLAYTGARAGEITQLRGVDVIERSGVPAIHITPAAGSTKTGEPRTVPLHEHLVEQGFLAFAKRRGPGPLFYREQKGAVEARKVTDPKRSPWEMVRAQLAEWIRMEVGIKDQEVQPTHGWRHTFRQRGSRYGMQEHIIDAICGHAPASAGRGYSVPTLSDMAEELKKFPRYEID